MTTGIPERRVEERLHVHGRDVKNYRELMPREAQPARCPARASHCFDMR